MKTNLILLSFVLLLTSCDLIIVEPIYNDRDRITGSYQVEEHSQTYNDYAQYSIYIRKSGSFDEVIIENFYDAEINVRATVVSNKIYISRQIVNGYEIEGVGTLYGSEIQLTYKVKDTYSFKTLSDFCDATARFN